MKLIKAEAVEIEEVRSILENGGIIIYPTETLYGIGAKYDDSNALKKIFEIKKRPSEKSFPLIIDLRHIEIVADKIPDVAWEFIKKYWPGPLTLILPAKKGLPEEITKNGTVAVRMPGESFALKLIKELPFPITATSANLSQMPAADCIEKVLEYFKEEVDLIIDGGKLPGAPSTIIDVTVNPPRVLRVGAIKIKL